MRQAYPLLIGGVAFTFIQRGPAIILFRCFSASCSLIFNFAHPPNSYLQIIRHAVYHPRIVCTSTLCNQSSNIIVFSHDGWKYCIYLHNQMVIMAISYALVSFSFYGLNPSTAHRTIPYHLCNNIWLISPDSSHISNLLPSTTNTFTPHANHHLPAAQVADRYIPINTPTGPEFVAISANNHERIEIDAKRMAINRQHHMLLAM